MIEIKLHYYQKAILKKLVYKTSCKFNELAIDGLESEHMNYHLKKLIDWELVCKHGSNYLLTDKGKDYCNLLDDQIDIPEKQPKTSIVIQGLRINNNGDVEMLVNRRLRQPYFGKVGGITGKVRFGESIVDAAKRELYEETGLTADNFELRTVYHKVRNRTDGVCVQDVLFYTFRVTDFHGELIEKTEFQENLWVSKSDVEQRKDLDFYDDFKFHENIDEHRPLKFTESIGIAEGF